MDPVEALRSIETRLRLVIAERLGDRWMDELPNGQLGRLQSWRQVEAGKRSVPIESDSLLEYTMTSELGKLVTANWDSFEDIFHDQNEFSWLMTVVQNVRNTIAHSRPLLPFERDLLSGAAGKVNHLVSLHRSNAGTSQSYYPLIDRMRDNLGTDWGQDYSRESTAAHGKRVDVGSSVIVQCSSTPVRGKKLLWHLWRVPHFSSFTLPSTDPDDMVEGESVEFNYEFGPADVAEDFALVITLKTNSEYARFMRYGEVYDDVRYLSYAVNPND